MPVPVVPITVSHLGFRVKVSRQHAVLAGTNVSLTNYVRRYNETQWDSRNRRLLVMRQYRHYDTAREMLYLPRCDLQLFLDFLTEYGVSGEIDVVPPCLGSPVDIQIRPEFPDKDVFQTQAIASVTTDDPLSGIAAPPGGGKTYAAIKALSILGRRSLITVAGLTEQWVRAIRKFTTLGEDDVYLIQGADSLRRLHDQIDKTLFPKIIVASIPTLRPYAQDPEVEALYSDFDSLMHHLNVGVRVIDEAHLNFHANYICDLRLNPAKTIVLTATFDNARPDVKKIFDTHYPPEIRFGEGKFDRYADVYAYEYGTGRNDTPHHRFKTPQGYSHVKFEMWLLKHPIKMEQAWAKWRYPISANYDNIRAPGERALLLFATRAMCEEVQKRITAEYPHLTNTLYMQEHDDDVLERYDVIISTIKKAGTGRDIGKLRTAIAYISIDSSPTNLQVFGRLRKLPDGTVPEFAFLYHRDIPAQVRHADKRRAVLQGRARKYYAQSL